MKWRIDNESKLASFLLENPRFYAFFILSIFYLDLNFYLKFRWSEEPSENSRIYKTRLHENLKNFYMKINLNSTFTLVAHWFFRVWIFASIKLLCYSIWRIHNAAVQITVDRIKTVNVCKDYLFMPNVANQTQHLITKSAVTLQIWWHLSLFGHYCLPNRM